MFDFLLPHILMLFWGRCWVIVLLQIGSWFPLMLFTTSPVIKNFHKNDSIEIFEARSDCAYMFYCNSNCEQKSLKILIYSFNCFILLKCSFMFLRKKKKKRKGHQTIVEQSRASCHCAFNLFLDKFYDSLWVEENVRASDEEGNVMGKSDVLMKAVEV